MSNQKAATTFEVAPVKPDKLKFDKSSVKKSAEVVAEYWKGVFPLEKPLKFEVNFIYMCICSISNILVLYI